MAVRRDWTLAIERLRAAIAEAEASAPGRLPGPGHRLRVPGQRLGGLGRAGGGRGDGAARRAGRRPRHARHPPAVPDRDGPGATRRPRSRTRRRWRTRPGSWPTRREAFATVGSEALAGHQAGQHLRPRREPGLLEVPLGTTPCARSSTLAGGRYGTTKAVFVGGPGGGAIAADELRHALRLRAAARRPAPASASGRCWSPTPPPAWSTPPASSWTGRAREACGKAVPCRIGTKRLVETLDRILAATPATERPRAAPRAVAQDDATPRSASSRRGRRARCSPPSTASRDEYRAHAERGECLAGCVPQRRAADR